MAFECKFSCKCGDPTCETDKTVTVQTHDEALDLMQGVLDDMSANIKAARGGAMQAAAGKKHKVVVKGTIKDGNKLMYSIDYTAVDVPEKVVKATVQKANAAAAGGSAGKAAPPSGSSASRGAP